MCFPCFWWTQSPGPLPICDVRFFLRVRRGPLSVRLVTFCGWQRIDHNSGFRQSPESHHRVRQNPRHSPPGAARCADFPQFRRKLSIPISLETPLLFQGGEVALTPEIARRKCWTGSANFRVHRPSYGGGKANVQEKTFLSNLSILRPRAAAPGGGIDLRACGSRHSSSDTDPGFSRSNGMLLIGANRAGLEEQ